MFPKTGLPIDQIPGRMDLLKKYRSAQYDEVVLATVLSTLELFQPGEEGAIVVSLPRGEKLCAMLEEFLADTHPAIRIVPETSFPRSLLPRSLMRRGFSQSAVNGQILMAIIDGSKPQALRKGLDRALSISPGGILLLAMPGQARDGLPDAVSEFHKTHPEFELLLNARCVVLRRPDSAEPLGIDRINLCLNFKACNLRCPACWNTHSPEKPDATGKFAATPWPHLDRLLRDPATQDKSIVVVGGGEPFLYPDMASFLMSAPTQRRRLMIMTNATLLHRSAAFWEAAQRLPITLSVSLDAARPETYAFVRQPATWEATMRNIDRFLDMRDRENPLLRFQTSFVVLRQNVGEIMEFMELNRQWGSEYVHFHPAMSAGFPEAWRLSSDDPELVRQIIDAAAFGERHGIQLDPIDHIIPRGLSSSGADLVVDPRSTCHEYRDQVAIDVVGDTFVCDTAFRVGFSMGNAFDESMEKLWNGGRWRSLREAHAKGRQGQHPLCRHCLMDA